MDEVEQIRSFNREVTRRIGALDTGYLGRGRPFGEARLMFEIGVGSGKASVAGLRRRLGLDPVISAGCCVHWSGRGWWLSSRTAGTGAAVRAWLTQLGRAEYDAYEDGSDALARSMLELLQPGQRQRLLAAMADESTAFSKPRASNSASKICRAETPRPRWPPILRSLPTASTRASSRR